MLTLAYLTPVHLLKLSQTSERLGEVNLPDLGLAPYHPSPAGLESDQVTEY